MGSDSTVLFLGGVKVDQASVRPSYLLGSHPPQPEIPWPRGGSTPSSVITNRMTSSTVIVRRSGEAFEAARARGHVMPLEG